MAESPKKVLRFTRIHLENWRNFSKIDIDLQRRAFFVGPNASGKSNLLDAFRFLRDIVSVGGGLHEAVRKRGGVSSLRCNSARQYSTIVVKAQIGNEQNQNLWVYEIKFTQNKQRIPVIKSEIVHHKGSEVLRRPDAQDKKDSAGLTQTYLEQVNANRKFRDVAAFLLNMRYLHIVPQLIREPDRFVGKVNDPYGGDFLEQIARTPVNIQKARLRRITDALKAAVPQLLELRLHRDDKGIAHLQGRFEHWRPHTFISEEHFSDGTIRMLGFLWALLDGTGPLLLEEPELSLHPEIIRLIPQLFFRIQRKSGRQVLISTHSTDLLHDRGIGLDECFVLKPGKEGTSISPASAMNGIKLLLDGGSSLAEAVLPHTKPKDIDQLIIFDQ